MSRDQLKRLPRAEDQSVWDKVRVRLQQIETHRIRLNQGVHNCIKKQTGPFSEDGRETVYYHENGVNQLPWFSCVNCAAGRPNSRWKEASPYQFIWGNTGKR